MYRRLQLIKKMSKVVRSRLMRRVGKNPVAVAVVLVADEDFLAGGLGAEDVETTSKRAKFKRKGREAGASRPRIVISGLQRLNVGSLQALRAAGNLEFDCLSLVEGAVALRLDRGEMDEHVLATLALDETKALAGVKPLHYTLFFHRSVPFQ
jgi:hypothetical protein